MTMTQPPQAAPFAPPPTAVNEHDMREHDTRRALLARMINAVRNTAVVNALSDSQLQDAVEDWDDVMAEVPTDQLNDLRRLGLSETRRYDGDGKTERTAKSAVDFLNLWRALENAKAEAAAEEARRQRDIQWHQMAKRGEIEAGAGFVAAQLQKGQRFESGLIAVTCECVDGDGYALPAFLSSDRTHWVCRHSISRGVNWCNFRWPVVDTKNAPARGKAGPLVAVMARQNVSVSSGAASDPTREAAEQCGLDFDAFEPLQLAQFRAFTKWWRSKYECPLTMELLQEYFPKWQEEQQEKEREALAA